MNEDIPAPRPAYNERLLDDNSRQQQQPQHPQFIDNQLFALSPALRNTRNFDESLEYARRQRKLLLVNLIDEGDFRSHAITRDVWNAPTVGEVLAANFLMWQRGSTTLEAQDFVLKYNIQAPFVGGIQPVTGQLVKTFNLKQFCDEASAVGELIDFLGLRPIAAYLEQKQDTSQTRRCTPQPSRGSSPARMQRVAAGGALVGLAAAAAVPQKPRRCSPASPRLDHHSSDSSRGKRSRPPSVMVDLESDVGLASEIDFNSTPGSLDKSNRRKFHRSADDFYSPGSEGENLLHSVVTTPRGEEDDKGSVASTVSEDTDSEEAAKVTATYATMNQQLAALAAERRQRLGHC